MDTRALLEKQKEYFASGATLSYEFRARQLQKLADALNAWEDRLTAALWEDLKKPKTEAVMTETGLVRAELSHARRHLKRWMRTRRVKTPLAQFPSKSRVFPQPLGVSLIVAPWNYPVQLSLCPLIGAIAAGCCACVKLSANAPHTADAISQMLRETFDENHVAPITGSHAQHENLTAQKFDFIFFTGSGAAGRDVLKKAAANLTPVLLELGGKSPVLIDESANIPLAAKRVAFGKCLNAGQTCVAPDYVLLPKAKKDEFISEYQKAVAAFYPNGTFDDSPAIVNARHFERLQNLMKTSNLVFGGECDEPSRRIAPAVACPVSWDEPLMCEEIFGPILPVLTYENWDDAIRALRSRDRPLALYVFSESRAHVRDAHARLRFGGGCVNDTIVHLSTNALPFGGVGESGMGHYHGRASFDAFSHECSVLQKSTRLDLPMRYAPYTEKKLRLIRMFLK